MKRDEIWVICDRHDNCSYEHLKQMIGKASELGKKASYSVVVVCIGEMTKEQCEELFCYGADKVLLCTEEYVLSEREFANCLLQIIEKNKPKVIMFPASVYGKAVAAYTSSKLSGGLTADCIDIEYEDGEFSFSRAAMNASIVAKIMCVNSEIELCTVKNNVFPVPEKDTEEKNGVIEICEWNEDCLEKDSKVEVIKIEKLVQKSKAPLDFSNIVFGIGRGVNEDTYEIIKKLAQKIGAEIAGTRAVVEAGVMGKERQVGQSGINISPNVYVAFGISGATQHIVGIKNAKLVIAINQDENATIFDYADYKVVADVNDIAKALCDMIEVETPN